MADYGYKNKKTAPIGAVLSLKMVVED